MSDPLEIEEVSFLSGEEQEDKRSKYEPNHIERCRQVICTQSRAIVIALITAATIVSVALIAALARAPCPEKLSSEVATNLMVTTESSIDENFPWKNIRLPTTIKPVNYDIFLHPNLTTLKYSGKVTITMKVLNATDFVVLHHAKEIDVHSHNAYFTSSREALPIVKTIYSSKQQQRYMRFSTTLAANTLVELKLVFVSELSEKMSGFYASHYKTSTGEKRVIATTHFEPSDARRAFPCFDEPAFKATFMLSIVRDRKHISLFNMPRVRTDAYQGDPDLAGVSFPSSELVLDTYQHSVVMSSYLVAFVVCDFMHKTAKTKRNVTVSVYTPPDMINQSSYALDAAVKILDYYETFFQIEYPLPKLDLIAIPDFDAGAMENWGLITYRMTSVLYDVTQSSTYNRQRIAVTVAHELAHQWFGNLVTMAWWDDLWLNEGFASYMEYIGADIAEPEFKMNDEQFLSENLLRALARDASTQSHPIMAHITRSDQIFSMFDAISYNKGSSVLKMLADYIGNTTFHSGLFQYLTRHKMSNAKTSDLWRAFTEATENRVNVSSIMNTWTMQMGYPLVHVSLQGKQVTMSQHRFLLDPEAAESKNDSPFGYQWKIPITYITDTITKRKTDTLFSDSKTFTLPKPSEWIKLNARTVGFYRVNYDDANWSKLSHVLLTSHQTLSAQDRAGLLDDAFSIARSGLLSLKTALTLSRYLRNEREYVPWVTGMKQLGGIHAMLRNTPAENKFKQFMRDLVKPVMTVVGWKDEGPPLKRYLRSLMLGSGLVYEIDEVIKEGKTRFREWMDEGKEIPADLRNNVNDIGVTYGSWTEIMYCYKIMNSTQIPSQKQAMIRAMTATRDADNIQRLLSMSLDRSKFDPEDGALIIQYLGMNHAASVLAWRYFKQNFDTILDKYGAPSFSFRNLLRTPEGFKTQYDLEEIESFYKSKDFGDAIEVRQTLETVKTNIKWRQRHEQDVIQWLDANPI